MFEQESHLKTLTLLHSNDLHGDFMAEELDDKLVGGVSMLSGYLRRVRNREKNVIYAIAGDMFRGSVIDSEYMGISTIQIMNLLSPDVVTIGNHEVDYGLPHLLFIEKCASFPIVNANFYIKMNGTRLFTPYHIIERDGLKVLFIGIITEEVLHATKSDELIGTLLDIEDAAREVGKICDAYNTTDVDLTVLLTHIGFEEDKKLAAALDPAWSVDLIIGGHSHTIMEKPEEVNGVVIAQAGTGTDQIGRFDITINTDINRIHSYKWKCVPIDSHHCSRDKELESIITNFKNETDVKYGRLLTRFQRELYHPVRNEETELGNLFADIMRDSFACDICMVGSGSIRLEKFGPVVTFGNLCDIFPYDDAVYRMFMTGAQLKIMAQHVLSKLQDAEHNEFYQFSNGVHMEYDLNANKVLAFTHDGEELHDDKLYSVAIQKFHFNNTLDFLGVDKKDIEKNGQFVTLATSARNVIEEWFVAHNNISAEVENRIVVLKDGQRYFPSKALAEANAAQAETATE